MSDTPTGQPSPLETRLREWAYEDIGPNVRTDIQLAAHTLARLRAENERLTRERDEAREALEGFLALEAMDPDDRSDYDIDSAFEAARRALTPEPDRRAMRIESTEVEHDRVWNGNGGSSTRSVYDALKDLESELVALRERVARLEHRNGVEP